MTNNEVGACFSI